MAAMGFAFPMAPLRAADVATPLSSGPAKGSLVIIGGGLNTPDITNAAADLAGGRKAHWVVIPTASTDKEIQATPQLLAPPFIKKAGASFTVLHTRDRMIADTESFVAPILTATGVYFLGGRQWRLVDIYAGTRTEKLLPGVLDRGGVIMGTSAGASIQGSYLVRGAPEGNETLMALGHERGFGYLTNVAVDQHVTTRHREADMAQVVAAHPGLLAIGIDESTAIIVKQNVFSVVGEGLVFITDGKDHKGLPYYTLKSGMRFDLASWKQL